MLIVHRGCNNHKYLENSIKGILDSLNTSYIYGIECDLRLSKDNNIILNHNSYIKCNNDIKFIKDMDIDYIIENNIPLLTNLLNNVTSNKILLLEIKEEGNNFNRWIKVLNDILIKYSALNIYLCSFNYNLLLELKKYFKNKIGLIVGYTINKNKDINNFDFVMYHYTCFKYTLNEVMVWTINDVKKYNEFKNKVKYIITDKAYLFK